MNKINIDFDKLAEEIKKNKSDAKLKAKREFSSIVKSYVTEENLIKKINNAFIELKKPGIDKSDIYVDGFDGSFFISSLFTKYNDVKKIYGIKATQEAAIEAADEFNSIIRKVVSDYREAISGSMFNIDIRVLNLSESNPAERYWCFDNKINEICKTISIWYSLD